MLANSTHELNASTANCTKELNARTALNILISYLMKIVSPLFVMLPRKTKADKKVYLNLNGYRNWHYLMSNDVKVQYAQAMAEQLAGLKFKSPIELKFTYYKAQNRKIDRANVLSVIEKFFCDALVEYGCITDDNDEYIKSTHYETGGIDKNNPRCEITINESQE